MLDDFKQSLRVLRRVPALTVAAVCTLAIAIGAAAAIFSVIDKVLLFPLPIANADRVVVIWPQDVANAHTVGEVSHATFRTWQQELRGLSNLAAIGSTNWTLILREGAPETVPVAAVSASFFPLMGTPAAAGRTLLPEDDQRDSSRVAVVSHGSWKHRFGGDPDVVGRRLRFNDAAYTIVGVMPEGFEYPRGAELWVPLVPQLVDAGVRWSVDILAEPGFGLLFLLGRLNPGVTRDAASEELSALMARDAGDAFRPGMKAVVTPLDEHIFGVTRPAVLAIAACVALLLLIACANVAVMLLVRAATCAHDTMTRLAIGATRWQVVRQSLSDALVLTGSGGVIGLPLAYWTVHVLVALAPSELPRLDAVRVDGRTLVFTGAVCVIAAALVGLGPGVQASRWNFANVVNGGGVRSMRSHRWRRPFVVVQVGLALMLVACAGLVGRSFMNLLRIDVGFDPISVLTLDVTMPDVPGERHNALYAALLPRVRAMPGVVAAGAVLQRPLEHTGIGQDATILIEGQRTGLEFRDWERNPTVNYESVTPGYLAAIGTQIVRGRAFVEADNERGPLVAIVSEGLARRLWPGLDPIGKRILPPGTLRDEQGGQRWSTVVGVAEDARYRGLADSRFDLYVPYRQIPNLPVKHLVVKTSRDPLLLAGPIRAEARRIEPAVLVERITTMDQLVGRATAPWRFSASTLGLLSVLALILASSGIYATVSRSVVERTREIGVRVSVGAAPRAIVRLILREGLGLTIAGIAIGLVAAIGAARALTGLLFDVRPVDPFTLAATALLLILVSGAAIVLPAWRAAYLDPAVALRRQ